MKVVAAYLLALLGGNPAPDAKAIKAILGSGMMEDDSSVLVLELDTVYVL